MLKEGSRIANEQRDCNSKKALSKERALFPSLRYSTKAAKEGSCATIYAATRFSCSMDDQPGGQWGLPLLSQAGFHFYPQRLLFQISAQAILAV